MSCTKYNTRSGQTFLRRRGKTVCNRLRYCYDGLTDRRVAVSYTHLDVYKRQVLLCVVVVYILAFRVYSMLSALKPKHKYKIRKAEDGNTRLPETCSE